MGSSPVRRKRRAPVKSATRPRERLASLKVSAPFKAFVLDQFGELGDVVPRSMFGGVGLYWRGVFFGIIARDTLYLKVGDENRRDYDRAGMKPFRPYAHRAGTMQYFSVPVSVLESGSELAAWARKSIAVAERKLTH
jgi:TfoX/Sxy family transcriptional regulator of competence genes